jgi:hypothetical protein
MTWRQWLILVACVVFMGGVVYSCAARAHMKDRPELDHWFESLRSSNGSPCCSTVDGTEVRDIDWDTTVENGKSHYRVHIEGKWIVVRDFQVVTEPNRYGGPIVWVHHADGKPVVRCFMPGAGG